MTEMSFMASPPAQARPWPPHCCPLRVHRSWAESAADRPASGTHLARSCRRESGANRPGPPARKTRSEEHTSELQSRLHLVCRLLLEKKKKNSSIDKST